MKTYYRVTAAVWLLTVLLAAGAGIYKAAQPNGYAWWYVAVGIFALFLFWRRLRLLKKATGTRNGTEN